VFILEVVVGLLPLNLIWAFIADKVVGDGFLSREFIKQAL